MKPARQELHTIAYQAGRRRTPFGMVELTSLFAHEARHTEGNGYPHVSGCPNSPTQTACDETYDVSNPGAYGVAYYLEDLWTSGAINLGYSCDPIWQAFFANSWAGIANFDAGNFGGSSGGGGGGGMPPTSASITVTATSGSLAQTVIIALTITH